VHLKVEFNIAVVRRTYDIKNSLQCQLLDIIARRAATNSKPAAHQFDFQRLNPSPRSVDDPKPDGFLKRLGPPSARIA